MDALIQRIEAYDPNGSADNRADELELHRSIVMATGLGSMNEDYDRTFVRSIDAAMTLVPDGANLAMRILDGKGYAGIDGVPDGDVVAATLALALCAAALRARTSMEGQPHDQ